MSTLRYHRVTIFPRKREKNMRDEELWVVDLLDPITEVRVGVSTDRTSRAAVMGDVEIEILNMRFPYTHKGRDLDKLIGIGAVVRWDGDDWDIAAPALERNTRVRSTRHLTAPIRRRPYRLEVGLNG